MKFSDTSKTWTEICNLLTDLSNAISGLYEVSDTSKSWTEICNLLTDLQNAGL